MSKTENKWPKAMPDLTDEQIRIKDDFMHLWMEGFPKKYGAMEIFNQNYPRLAFKKDKNNRSHWRTLEIGGGLGSHIVFEDLSIQEYTVLELRQNMLDTLKELHPEVKALLGDAQQTYAESDSYDRIIAIHVLEHLPNLPECIRQMHRVLVPGGWLISSFRVRGA